MIRGLRKRNLLEPKLTKYIPHRPTVKQSVFLLTRGLDVFYGGAAGGGKSDALLMAALQYVDCPDYNALLIRDTYANLNKPEGLLTRAHEWLQRTDANWSGENKTYHFPSGATLGFGYLDGPLDHFNYQGAAYQFVGIDEVVNIRENQALYLFSRLRKLEGSKIPIRFRCASNPPTAEQMAKGAWVKDRYVNPLTRKNRRFISARLIDNPFLDATDYINQLNQLDPVTRAQLLKGDWDIKVKGRMFDRSWFQVVDQCPASGIIKRVRFWDLAATEKTKAGQDPDWTAGVKVAYTDTGLYYIEDVIRFREKPLETKKRIRQTAERDGTGTEVAIEQEPGSSGKIVVDDYIRLLGGFVVKGVKTTGSKRQRAMPYASQAEAGNVYLVNGPWIPDYLDEIDVFPDGAHDDQVDGSSGAFSECAPSNAVNIRWI